MSGLAAELLAAVDPAWRESLPEAGTLEPVLSVLVRDATAAWPQFSVEAARYVRHVAVRLPAEPSNELPDLHWGDLYLAFACVQQDRTAISELNKMLGELRPIIGRLDPTGRVMDEVLQDMREQLLLGGDEPGIAGYAGRGALRNWLGVTAARRTLRMLRQPAGQLATSVDLMAALPSPETNVEIRQIKLEHREELSRAFEGALATLRSRDRNLLRYYFVDGLRLEEIGKLYRVNRSTVSRWLATTREQLFQTTRDALVETLKLRPAEADSLMRFAHSQIDVSIGAFLAATGVDKPEE